MPGPVHCPYCQSDISFLGPAFAAAAPSPYEHDTARHGAGGASAAIATTLPSDVPSGGDMYNTGYQDVCWKKMRERAALLAHASGDEIVARAVETRRPNRKDGSIVVHMMFDGAIVPTGGVLYMDMKLRTATGTPPREPFDEAKMRAYGYVVIPGPDGNPVIKTVNDCPVGPIYDILMYWAAGTPTNTHYRRWHMTQPIVVNPRRNHCPEFMDENVLAFTAFYEDDANLKESLETLCRYCTDGIATKGGVMPPAKAVRAIMLA